MASTLTVIVGDTHIGGTTALALPEFTTDEGQTVKASDAQKWIYEKWLDFWQAVRERAGIRGKTRKHRLVVVHMGDAVDGLHHATVQALPNLEDQENMACELLRPLAAMADGGYYQIRGTEAHAGQAAQSEVRIARELGAKACEWELDLEIDGVLMNFTHHGRAGRQDWTSSAANQAAGLCLARAGDAQPIPRLAFRAHAHTLDDSGEKLEYTRLIVCPAWQLKTAFAHKVAAGKRSDIGGLVVEGDAVDFTRARYHAAPGQVRRIVV